MNKRPFKNADEAYAVFFKMEAVYESCETPEQREGAVRYFRLMMKKFSFPNTPSMPYYIAHLLSHIDLHAYITLTELDTIEQELYAHFGR